ncbi:hypothetical protein VULLAG_LOCUS11669 [Vulpes lagopus]
MGIREFPGGAPRGKSIAVGMRRSPDVSPRRLSDISPQLRQLKYLVVDEAIKEDLKWSRSVEDLSSGPLGLTSIEERILRITGYYGYQPWAASYKKPLITFQMTPLGFMYSRVTLPPGDA